MNIAEIKDLMSQFDQSSLREFSYSNAGENLHFSKNQHQVPAGSPVVEVPQVPSEPISVAVQPAESSLERVPETVSSPQAEGSLVESPLVGVAYLSPAPDKPAFVEVGDSVKKGQTLVIIEAMKVMNEVPADRDGVVTEILVANQEIVEFGQGLVRIK